VVGNVGFGGIAGVDGTLGAGDIATDFVSASYAGAPPMDVFPAPGGALVGSGDATTVVEDDFNCTQRPAGTPDAGAYLADPSGNPGWTLQAGFKECGGGGGDDGTTDDGGLDESGSGSASEGADSADSGADDASASDASASASAASETATGGSGSDAGADGGDGGDDEGCGCTAGSPVGSAGLLAMILLALRRRITR
jgi:MYXO-CTERM domain-containing protein